MKKATRKRLTVLLMAICLFSTAMFLNQLLDNSAVKEASESALHLATSQEPAVPEPVIQAMAAEIPETTAPPEPIWIPETVPQDDPSLPQLQEIDLAALQAENPDVIGWIFLPDTYINYPITQGQDNEHYLKHAWNGVATSAGSIFMESMNTPDFTDFNTILYGHNMMTGIMFGNLRRFSIPGYWEGHPYVYILTPENIFRYEIFAAYQAPVDSSTYGLSFNQIQTRINFLEHAAEKSVIDTGIHPEVTDRILTLSTCTGGGYESRWVVQARLKMIRTEVN